MNTERAAVFTYGPRFFYDGPELMFEFIIDHANRIGPRVATEADRTKHAEAFQAFEQHSQPIGEEVPEPQEPEPQDTAPPRQMQPRAEPRRPNWPPKRKG